MAGGWLGPLVNGLAWLGKVSRCFRCTYLYFGIFSVPNVPVLLSVMFGQIHGYLIGVLWRISFLGFKFAREQSFFEYQGFFPVFTSCTQCSGHRKGNISAHLFIINGCFI
jgi:hypothetical protein